MGAPQRAGLDQVKHMELGEDLTIIFAALTLLATMSIGFLAYHLSSDFSKLTKQIGDLNQRMDESFQTEERFKFQSEMLLRVANNLYRTNSLLLTFFRRRKETGLVSKEGREAQAAYDVLIDELAGRNLEVAETIDFFRALVDSDSDAVQALIDKRPTRDTVGFLGRLVNVVPKEMKPDIEQKFHGLAARVMGIDSSRWTGRARSRT